MVVKRRKLLKRFLHRENKPYFSLRLLLILTRFFYRLGLREPKTKAAPFYKMSRMPRKRKINCLFIRLVPYVDEEI